jgi:hypothetical protein
LRAVNQPLNLTVARILASRGAAGYAAGPRSFA